MIIGSSIYHLATCKDSFEWIKNNLDKPDGTVLWTDHLENAHGRQGRKWLVNSGQLLITILLKPTDVDVKHLNYLNMALSVGFLKPLQPFDVGIKWPNDFIMNNKKLGGMLIKTIWENMKVKALIVGLGLNINNKYFPEELENSAISLHNVLGKDTDLESLLRLTLRKTNDFYQKWLNKEYETIFQCWQKEQFFKNRYIKLHKFDGTVVTGVVEDFSPTGDVFLRTEFGEFLTIPFYVVENTYV